MHILSHLRKVFSDYLEANQFNKAPEELYEPNNYFLSMGGKRMRPVLVLLATHLYKGKLEDALPAALAIEYFHNFSLIHDDMMDAAPLRRGQVTVHEKYGMNTAILSGDALLVYAYKYLSMVPAHLLSEVLQIFNETAIEVCEGQQLDMNFEKRDRVSEAEYLWMIRQKTSVVLAAGLKIGALIAGAGKEDAEALYQYALNLGIAFQIQDDILDCYGNAELVGKQPGGDIIQNKKTLLLIKAIEKGIQNNDNRLQQLIQTPVTDKQEKVSAVISLYEEWNIRTEVEMKRNALIDEALSHLETTTLPEEQKAVLRNLVDYLVVREF